MGLALVAFRVSCGQSLGVRGPQGQVLATHLPQGGAYNNNEKFNAIYILSCITLTPYVSNVAYFLNLKTMVLVIEL